MAEDTPKKEPKRPRLQTWIIIFLLALLPFYSSLHLDTELTKIARALASDETFNAGITTDPVTPSPARTAIDRGWCPQAECKDSPVCHPCRRRFLMIITLGRSASTTLTWMMDLLPGIRMGVEYNNIIKIIRDMLDATKKPPFSQRLSPKYKYGAHFHNPMPEGSFGCVAQRVIEAVVPPLLNNETYFLHSNGTYIDTHADSRQSEYTIDDDSDIVGFKTILLVQELADESELPEVAAFLKEHFPCTRYLINYSSKLWKVARSQDAAFANDKKTIQERVDRITRNTGKLLKLGELLGSDATTLDSSLWTKNVSELNRVVRWLGFDATCNFPKLLELNTGRSHRRLKYVPTPSYNHTVTNVELDTRCHYVGRSV